MKKYVIIGLLACMLALPVFAQTRQNSPVSQELKERRDNVRERMSETREQFKQELEVRKEKFREEINMKREELKQSIESERALLQTRLSQIRDERKKQAILKVADQVNALNERMLGHYTNVLNQLEQVLERIVSRIEKAENAGLNISPLEANVDVAKQKIEAAREAITTQTGKTYTILTATTTDATAKQEVGAVRQMLHGDLKRVETAAKAARDAVHDVARNIRKLIQVRGVDDTTSTVTSSVPSTP